MGDGGAEIMGKIKVIHIVDDLKVGGLERTLAMIALVWTGAALRRPFGCLAGGGALAMNCGPKA